VAGFETPKRRPGSNDYFFNFGSAFRPEAVRMPE
jgi:hypothetical protein